MLNLNALFLQTTCWWCCKTFHIVIESSDNVDNLYYVSYSIFSPTYKSCVYVHTWIMDYVWCRNLSIWCDYIWICKNVQYLNEKPVKVVERSKFTIVNMFSMHINIFFLYFIYFSYSLRSVYFLDCLYLGLLGVGTSLFPPLE